MFARFPRLRTQKVKLTKQSFHSSTALLSKAKWQGLKGKVALITGDFSTFTMTDKNLINQTIESAQQTLVLVNDRNIIPTPANARARWIRKEFENEHNLQVMVLYGVPELSENPKAIIDYSQIIKKSLPEHIQISSLHCQHHYSSDLAQFLEVKYQPIALEQNNKVIAGINPSQFSKSVTFQEQSESIDETKRRIKAINAADHPNMDAFFRRITWDLKGLNKRNEPIVIAEIGSDQERQQFSNPDNMQVYDMPIYMPGMGWRIPQELSAYLPQLAYIQAAERAANNRIEHCFAYLTTDSGVVAPNHYARRSGLHVDGFLSAVNRVPENDGLVYGDNTYIVCDDLGTEFYAGPFDLSQVDHNNSAAVLKAFDEQGKYLSYTQAKPYSIYRLTVNDVHAVHPNDSGEYRQRSFLKVTFSVRPFNRLGSTINPLFKEINWHYVPRDNNARNTQNYTGACPPGFNDCSLNVIDFNQKTAPNWCGTFFKTKKNPELVIQAKPAKQGERLETIVDNDLVTTNFSGANDIEVIRTCGDRYFLPKWKFEQLYKPVAGSNNYAPKNRQLEAIEIDIPISVISRWGMRQNLPKGSIIVNDGNESWGVHPKSFEATYVKI